MTTNDIAQQIIDHWVANDYGGDRAAMIDEVGSLDDYAMRIVETIEQYDLDTDDIRGTDGIHHCAVMVELYM